MSKTVLKIAGRRPMLLALIVMATITLGLLFSGWLTPTRVKAQNGNGNGGSNDESADCEAVSTTNWCTDGSIILTNITYTPSANICVGNSITITENPIIQNSLQIFDTSYTNANPNSTNVCSDTYVTISGPAPTIISNWWTVTGVGSFSGTGLSTPSLTPSGGNGTITFYTIYSTSSLCDTNIKTYTNQACSSFNVVSVDSLTPIIPDIPKGLGGLEPGSSPPTYWVCPSYPGYFIKVRAKSSPDLSADQLPDGWVFTGGSVEFDKLNRGIFASALKDGPVTFTVTCGSSSKTIILEADKEKTYYDVTLALYGSNRPGFTDPNPIFDACGDSLYVNCDCDTSECHFAYRYNTILVGACYYEGGQNSFLYKTTVHNCSILRTWHETLQPGGKPYKWTITKYDCSTGSGPSYNCRIAQDWDNTWKQGPADSMADPTLSIENQGTPSTPCPLFNWH